jgi:hypothetical protein
MPQWPRQLLPRRSSSEKPLAPRRSCLKARPDSSSWRGLPSSFFSHREEDCAHRPQQEGAGHHLDKHLFWHRESEAQSLPALEKGLFAARRRSDVDARRPSCPLVIAPLRASVSSSKRASASSASVSHWIHSATLSSDRGFFHFSPDFARRAQDFETPSASERTCSVRHSWRRSSSSLWRTLNAPSPPCGAIQGLSCSCCLRSRSSWSSRAAFRL